MCNVYNSTTSVQLPSNVLVNKPTPKCSCGGDCTACHEDVSLKYARGEQPHYIHVDSLGMLGFDDINVKATALQLLLDVKTLAKEESKQIRIKTAALSLDYLKDGIKTFIKLEEKYPATTAKVYAKRIKAILEFSDAITLTTKYVIAKKTNLASWKQLTSRTESLNKQIHKVYENNQRRAKKLAYIEREAEKKATREQKRAIKKEKREKARAEKENRRRNDEVLYNVWTSIVGEPNTTALKFATLTGKQLRKLQKKLAN